MRVDTDLAKEAERLRRWPGRSTFYIRVGKTNLLTRIITFNAHTGMGLAEIARLAIALEEI